MGDVEDFPDMRIDTASPGPRVTFNIQDTVKYIHFLLYATVAKVALSSFRQINIFSNNSDQQFFCVCINIISPSISIC